MEITLKKYDLLNILIVGHELGTLNKIFKIIKIYLWLNNERLAKKSYHREK